MKHQLQIINQYLLHNDLLDKVLSVGGNNTRCRVIMDFSSWKQIFKFTTTIKKYTQCQVSLRINKSNNCAIINFKRG